MADFKEEIRELAAAHIDPVKCMEIVGHILDTLKENKCSFYETIFVLEAARVTALEILKDGGGGV